MVYASSVMGSDAVIEKPDLESHSLIRFLDKFAYRNTKTKEETRGGSIMQPLQSTKSGSDQILRSKGASGVSVNTASFWTKKVENVAAEDAFFHEYFSQIGRTNSARRAAPEQEADRAEQHENEIWKALTSGQGEAGDEEADMADDLEGDMADEDESEGEMPDWDSSSDDSDGGADVAVEDGEGDGEDEFMAAGGSDSEGDAEAKGGADDGDKKEDKKEDNSKAAQRKARKKQLRDLPMFASAEDYAELLAGGDDDDDEDMG
ncbi:hypothetical protein IMZ48_00450 [Candidatus Bathyarchaeota archaeon]|nr:hypothetical protein [Candidatus Bathyarchaeota archaeon]